MNNITDLIKDSLRIEDIIADSVKLRPASRGFVGLCPFHKEDSPSFHVYTDTQSYFCFGCKKAGNIFTFIMDSQNLSFRDALSFLSQKAGIPLHSLHDQNTFNHDILHVAQSFFSQSLSSLNRNVALAYLLKRSLSESDASTFSLGYAPDSWDSLTLFLRDKGFSDHDILNSGLALQSQKGLYDRFRGRIIFPIHSTFGRTIAFGGRLISGQGAKYINSPESPIFHKRSNLYLLDKAKDFIREKKRSILCEGYMDAIRLHKSGFNESVASLGTSLTAQQAELLARFADRCYICYDSDTAGQIASVKGMYILQASGLDVYVISLPDGKDPDEFLLTHSPQDFEKLIQSAEPLILAHLSFLRERLNDPLTRKSALKDLFSSLGTISPSEVLQFKSELSQATRIIPAELEHIIISKYQNSSLDLPGSVHSKISLDLPQISAETHEPRDHSLECALCFMLMHNEAFRLNISPDDVIELILSPDIQTLALNILNSNPDLLELQWSETNDTMNFAYLEQGRNLCSQMLNMDDTERFKRIYSSLKRSQIERDIAYINSQPIEQRDMIELMRLYRIREKYQR